MVFGHNLLKNKSKRSVSKVFVKKKILSADTSILIKCFKTPKNPISASTSTLRQVSYTVFFC